MIPTNKDDAYWRANEYIIPIAKDLTITTVLGIISKRKDGRFNWSRKHSLFHVNWIAENKQGVASSIELAKQKVEDGWLTQKPIA
jgi:hypothetical protein